MVGSVPGQGDRLSAARADRAEDHREFTAMIKVETRGKYAGVKIHLDVEECEALMALHNDGNVAFDAHAAGAKFKDLHVPLSLAQQMGKKISGLLDENPDLLKPRTPEQVAAILAKEVEKASMQLNAVKSGKKWESKHIDKEKLKEALLKHAE
jgi:hypothetical protein